MARASIEHVGPAPAADFLPIPNETPGWEGDRFPLLDKRLEKFIAAKNKIAELRDVMKSCREEMIAIGMEHGIVKYRTTVDTEVYLLKLEEQTVAKIAKQKTE